MRRWAYGTLLVAVAAVAFVFLSGADSRTIAQGGTTYRAPRATGGRPNLSGIRQALNGANWDIEGHAAQPAPHASLVGVYLAHRSIGGWTGTRSSSNSSASNFPKS